MSPSGEICIAPFHFADLAPGQPPPPSDGPAMSTTPAANARTVFHFRVDRRLEAQVGNHQMARISDVPIDHRVKVEVRTEDGPFETFWLDLGEAPDHRICLWLYPGYWHWIDNTWDPKLGCKCEELPPAGKP